MSFSDDCNSFQYQFYPIDDFNGVKGGYFYKDTFYRSATTTPATGCDLSGTWMSENGNNKMTLSGASGGINVGLSGSWDAHNDGRFSFGRFITDDKTGATSVEGTYEEVYTPNPRQGSQTGVFKFNIIDCNTLIVNVDISYPGETPYSYSGRWVRVQSAPTTPKIEVTYPDPILHPLAMRILVTENGKPVPHAKLKLHALDFHEGDKKLESYFLASGGAKCANCDSTAIEGKNFVMWKDPKQPLDFEATNGEANLEFFLPLMTSDAKLPEWEFPVDINFSVEYWRPDSTGKAVKAAVLNDTKELKTIGVITNINVTPKIGKYAGKEIPITEWDDDKGVEIPLSDLLIKGSDRVKVTHAGGKPQTLREGDGIGSRDRITINATGLHGNSIAAPKNIAVTVRFFDGFSGKLAEQGIIDLDFAKAEAERKFAPTLYTRSLFAYTLYSNAKSGEPLPVDKVAAFLVWLNPEAAPAIETGAKVAKAFAAPFIVVFNILNYAEGPVYVRVQSSVAIDTDEKGQLLVTTRGGNATLYTNVTGDTGFAVPAGKTAIVNWTTLMPVLKDTDPLVAQNADQELTSIPDPIASSPVSAMIGNATSNISAGSVSAGNITPVIPSPSVNATAPSGINQTNLTAPSIPASPTGAASIIPVGNVSVGNVSAGNVTAGAPSTGANVTAPGGRHPTNLTAPGVPTGPLVASSAAPTNNDQLGHASVIVSGQAVKQGITPAGSSNWYKFHAGANGIISVDVEGVPSDMRPDVTLHDKNFNSFAEKSATNPGDKLSFKNDIPMPGWVYVSVKDADGKAHSEPYTLTVSFDAVQDPYDPNNVLGDAAEITPGTAIKAGICPHGELDWYKLQANSGGIISVNVNAVPKDMRPGVSLYDKNFNRFEDKQATNAGDSLSFDKDLPAPGWAYVAIYDADGKAHSDPYTLTAALKSG